jgi:outer membrane protein
LTDERLPFALLLAALALLAAPPAQAVSLLDAYRDALRSDPTLREAAANRLATLEARPQARAALLPQIEGTGSYEYQYSSGTQTFTQRLETGEVGHADHRLRPGVEPRRAWQLRLTQTLFRWDQWVALRQADKQLARAEAEFRAAEQDLMARVAQRYFDMLGARATLRPPRPPRKPSAASSSRPKSASRSACPPSPTCRRRRPASTRRPRP